MDYNKLFNESTENLFLGLPSDIGTIVAKMSIYYVNTKSRDKCIEISRHLCDEINKTEPNSAIVICCRGFWIDEIYAENDLARYLHHTFVKYKDWYIDLTLKQFDNKLPALYISKSHLGKNQYIHQTYPEITDLNYINTLNNKL